VDGRCVDMPNEPPESNFKDKIRHRSYPCREQNGAIWTYMGPRTEPPPFPDLEWTQVPEGHFVLGKMLRECNWAQAFEGDIDDVHVSFLHSRLSVPTGGQMAQLMHTQRSPHLEVLQTEGGAMYGVRREANEREYNWRIKHYLFPSTTVVNGNMPIFHGAIFSQIWVPMDDEHTMQWRIYWSPGERLPEVLLREGASRGIEFLPNGSDWLGQWRTAANKVNDYLLDYDAQRTMAFCGISSVPVQDKAVQESMGPILDRTQEHLGRTDAMISLVRHRLIAAAKGLAHEGLAPPGVDQPHLYGVRSAIINLPKDANWVEETRDVVRAFTDLQVATSS
jgi:phenylpropionate dioxygenase-like ring-hydroxylating dioxygenase large terminal subunit